MIEDEKTSEYIKQKKYAELILNKFKKKSNQ
jgi:hypothetical protein